MNPLILDFETYYDNEYSLKRMPSMQYIRDPRFRVEGVAVTVPGKSATWVPSHQVEAFLRAVPWSNTLLVCHNSTFDGAILSERYQLRPAGHFCTMFAARYLVSQGKLEAEQGTALAALAPLVGMEKGNIETDDLATYGVQDANITERLFTWFYPQVPAMERELIDLHVRMATEPSLALNIPLLQQMASADKALDKIFPLVRKDETFAALLVKLGVQPEYKSTKTGRMKLALAKTDTFMQSLANHADERVRRLHEIRAKASSTIERTRSQRFLDVGSPLPVPQLYYGAHTGRGSGDDNLNLQNLKKTGDLRRALTAPAGHVLCVGDSAQIEVRVLAHSAEEEQLLERFRTGEDVYRAFAAERLYSVPITEVTGDQRQVAKAAVLALGFGQGANGFLNYCARFGIAIDPAEAERVVQVYRRSNRGVTGFWRQCERFVKTHGYQELPSGRRLYYPSLRIGADGMEYQRARIFRKVLSEGFTNVWYGLLTENYVQAAARDVVFSQALRLHRQGWRVANLVHDEIICVVPESRADECKAAMELALSTPPEFMRSLPTKGEVKLMMEYSK